MGLTKTAIKKVLGKRHVSLQALESIVVEIEAILNDRPPYICVVRNGGS